MDSFSALPLVVLAEKFAALPGIGMKTAQRLAYAVMEMPQEDAEAFAAAILAAKTQIHDCPVCQNLTEQEICPICSNVKRDRSTVCVVEGPKDVAAIERTHEYQGVYHVLHGLISPLDGITPEHLRIQQLLERIREGGISEIIMATNPSIEGEATAMYLSRLCKPLDVRVTRLAFGLPVGGVIEYTDEVTLYRALTNRSEM
ncbi:MAG: recombination mediator RecR [Oscillospiraceae bacterium]|nr:recombination protein RecR [Oscillospiraceae bacterium]MCR5305570.1 recombination mediator RecR [Oscillospiraceae bacterium]